MTFISNQLQSEFIESTPTILTQNISPKHSAKLRSCALDDADIIDARYSTIKTRTEGKKLTGYSLTGLAIPYFDHAGNPYRLGNGNPYYRIRPDWEGDPDADEKPKYLSPKNEGSRPYFAPTYKQWEKALRFRKIPIHITEGEFKAATLGKYGYAAIGLTGVHGFTDKTSRNSEVEEIPVHLLEDLEARAKEISGLEDSRTLPELDFIDNKNIWEGREVFLTFDSDIVHKWQVKEALKKLAEWLESKGAEPRIVILPTELDGEKNGVDDLIYRHGKEAYELLLWWAQPAFTYKKGKKVLSINSNPMLPIKADLLQSVLKDHWRYRPGIGWHNWTGTHWRLQDDGAGTNIDRDIYTFMRFNGWTLQGGNDKNNLLNHMRAKLMVEEWNPKTKIAFANGVLDLTTNEFTSQFKRDDFMTCLLPYGYDPIAQCPLWEQFLNQALGNDAEAIALVKAFFRWALTPKPSTKYDLEVCWDLYGEPGTGKGTVLDVLKQVVGIHNCGWFSTKTFNNDNALANLLDKPVSICPDDSGHLDDPGKFNRAITNEPVQVKLLYKNSFSTTLNTFLVRAYNKFISTTSGAQGLDRRIIALAFKNKPEVSDDELGEKLAQELPGIFNWAFSISLLEAKKTIRWAGNIKAVQEASTERFLFNNPSFEFLLEFYPEGGKAPIRDLHHHYAQWSKEKGDAPLSEKVFKAQILSFGCIQQPKIHGIQQYEIPPIKRAKVIQHLRIAANVPEKTIDNNGEIFTKMGEIGQANCTNSPVQNGISPTIHPLPEPFLGELGEMGEMGEIQSTGASIEVNLPSKESATDLPVAPESNTTAALDSIADPILQTPSPNPKGVITYKSLIFGKIGTTVIRFERQSLAKEWRELIYLVFGYSGVIAKIEKPTDKLKWKIIFDKFDKEAIDRLNKKDLSKSPPTRE
jgi:P4 family phage/plasmid primase-like protien